MVAWVQFTEISAPLFEVLKNLHNLADPKYLYNRNIETPYNRRRPIRPGHCPLDNRQGYLCAPVFFGEQFRQPTNASTRPVLFYLQTDKAPTAPVSMLPGHNPGKGAWHLDPPALRPSGRYH